MAVALLVSLLIPTFSSRRGTVVPFTNPFPESQKTLLEHPFDLQRKLGWFILVCVAN